MKRLNEDCYGAKVAGITVIIGPNDMNNFSVGNKICVYYDGKDHIRKVYDYPEDIGIVVKGYPFYYSDFEFVPTNEFDDWRNSDKYLGESTKMRENSSQQAYIEELAKYLVNHIIVRPIEEKDIQRHLRQSIGMFTQKVMEKFQLDTLDNPVIQKALRDLESAVRRLVDQENKDYQDWVDNYKDYDKPEEKPYGYKAELDNQDGSFDTIAITTDLTRDEFYKRLSRRYDMKTVRIVPCYSKKELNESVKTKNTRFNSLRESSSHIKTDFDVDREGFCLNYFTDELKGWFYVDLDWDEIDVKYHWENGDYYGPENDSGSLPGGYYGRGYEIDDIYIPIQYMGDYFFDDEDNEISKDEFLRLNNLSEESLKSHLLKAKELLSSEIEDYVYNNEEDFIQE